MSKLTLDEEIKIALTKKGYKWNEISITRWMNFYTHLFEIKLDGKFVEVYNTKTGTFED